MLHGRVQHLPIELGCRGTGIERRGTRRGTVVKRRGRWRGTGIRRRRSGWNQASDPGDDARGEQTTHGVSASILPGQEPIGQGAQQMRALAERRQGIDGLAVQKTDALLRRGDADHGRVSGLRARIVGAGRLAQ